MKELFSNIGEWAIDFGTSILENVWASTVGIVVADLVGYAYMFCGLYVMIKALAGAGNIMRPIAITSGFTVVALVIL